MSRSALFETATAPRRRSKMHWTASLLIVAIGGTGWISYAVAADDAAADQRLTLVRDYPREPKP